MVGDIYFAKIYFTDGEEYKLRPILIIKENSFGDVIYIPFTTNSNNKNGFKIDNSFLENGVFRKESYLILDKTCTIQKSLLERKIAKLQVDILANVMKEYCELLRK